MHPAPVFGSMSLDPQPEIQKRLEQYRLLIAQGVEEGIKKILIEQGWTPPPEKTP